MTSTHGTTAVPGGPVWVPCLFLLSLLVPFYIRVGDLLLMPHRIVLLVAFVPFFLKLFVMRGAGKVLIADWLMFGTGLWGALALIYNHGVGVALQPLGIFMVELFGGYLVARVGIRNAQDFRRMVWVFFFMLVFLVPFAALESFTRRPVLLDLLPGTSVRQSNAGIRLGMRRAQTIFPHPILFGIFVSTGFGLFFYALKPRSMSLIGVPLVALGTLFSLSTGALISFVMQSVFIAWEFVMRSMSRRWTLFGILAALAYILVDLISNRTPFHVIVTYASFHTGSAYNRILIWNYGMDNVWANPMFGLGLNEWARPGWMSGSMDNFWLFIAVHYGVPAVAMVLAALFLIVRRVSRIEMPDPDERLARAGYLTAVGGLVIAGGTVHYWHAMMAFAFFIFGSGVWAISGGTTQPGDEVVPEAPPKPISPYTRQTAPGRAIGTARGRPARAEAPPREVKTRPEPRHKAIPRRGP